MGAVLEPEAEPEAGLEVEAEPGAEGDEPWSGGAQALADDARGQALA